MDQWMEKDTGAVIAHGDLHDLLRTPDGARVTTPTAWHEQRGVWLERVVDLTFGGMPPLPDQVDVRLRSQNRVQRLHGEPTLSVYRVRAHVGNGHLDIGLSLLTPGTGAATRRGTPVVIDPDACWWNLDDTSVARVLASGVALARFDRTEVVPDPGVLGLAAPGLIGGLYEVVPGDGFGAVAAWAWGVHRVVDALLSLDGSSGDRGADETRVDTERVAVTGFSRGGKAALLAGATDQRIALVHAHASGAGGAAPFLLEGDGAEGMCVVERFPGWFGKDLAEYQGREAELPVDQHALLAAVAPRPLLITCGSDDAWANPAGTSRAVEAARSVYDLFGEPDAVEFTVRPGGHHHGPEDWAALLAFIGRRW